MAQNQVNLTSYFEIFRKMIVFFLCKCVSRNWKNVWPPWKSTPKRFGKAWKAPKKRFRKWCLPLITTPPDSLWKKIEISKGSLKLLCKSWKPIGKKLRISIPRNSANMSSIPIEWPGLIIFDLFLVIFDCFDHFWSVINLTTFGYFDL